MSLSEKFSSRLQELAERNWDIAAIEARFNKLVKEGFPTKTFNRKELKQQKKQIQDQVRTRAEEYNFFLFNCAQSTALALLEEFGLGNMEHIKALMPFPGIGGTGQICGGITGSLIAFGLHFGGETFPDREATGTVMFNSKNFIQDFKNQLGYLNCAEIQEHAIFGCNMDPGASEENMEAFAKAKGFEKCSLVPGIGASLAAGYIIDSILADN